MQQNETTCKTCYWYSVCPERSRLYPCREFKDTSRKSGRKDKPMHQLAEV